MLDPLGLTCSTPDGIASVRQLFLIRAEHVIDIPEPDPDTYTVDTISIAPASAFVEYEFEPDQIGFFTTPQLGPSGTSYTHTITTLRQGLSRAVADEIQKLIGGGYVAIIRTFEEQVLTVGTPAAPLIFRYEFTSGPVRNDTHTNAWNLESVSDRPAFHMDGNVDPPDEQVVPFAKLTVTESGTDSFRIRANGSRYASGTLITTLSGGISLRYTFTIGILSFTATIAPGASATTAANWTVTSGSSVEFASFISGYIASGTGFDFTFRPFYWGVRFPEGLMTVSLRVLEGALVSNTDTEAILLYSYAADIYGTTTKTTNLTFTLRNTVTAPVVIDWGDGTYTSTSILTSLTSISSATLPAGTKNFKIYLTNPSYLYDVRMASQSITSVYGLPEITSLKTCYINSNAIANPIDFSYHPALQIIVAQDVTPATFDLILTGVSTLTELYLRANTFSRTYDIAMFPLLKWFTAQTTSGINFTKTTGSNPVLQYLLFQNATGVTGALDFSECVNLQYLDIYISPGLTNITIGTSHALLQFLRINGGGLSSSNLNALVDAMYIIKAQRAGTGKIFSINSNAGSAGLSATSIEKILGTGAYAGIGLTQNGWTTSY